MYDFNLEMKLLQEAPELHRIFSDNVMCCQNMLVRYQSIFPDFTDHTSLHSLEVIAFCNELVGENIDILNTDEIFVLLMAAYLHDSGMGISHGDYAQFSEELPMVKEYRAAHPDAEVGAVVRRFHNEFSGAFIRKYAALFDFPSEEHLFCVVQTSRGHRKTDLFDETEYPAEIPLPNGNVLRLPYLAALIRLADELDIAADRNLLFLYDLSSLTAKRDIIEFGKHLAIRHLNVEPDAFSAEVDYSNEELREELDELFAKLQETLDKCARVISARTPFTLSQTCIRIVPV